MCGRISGRSRVFAGRGARAWICCERSGFGGIFSGLCFVVVGDFIFQLNRGMVLSGEEGAFVFCGFIAVPGLSGGLSRDLRGEGEGYRCLKF